MAKINRVFLIGGGLLVFVCAWLIVVDVLIRSILAQSWLYSFEITGYAFAIAVAFGLSEGIHSKSHVRIDIAYQRFPLPVRCVLDAMAMAILTLLSIGTAWYATDASIYSLKIGARSNSSLAMPLAVPQSLWAIGLILFAATCSIVTLRVLFLEVLARWHEIAELAGAPRIEETLVE